MFCYDDTFLGDHHPVTLLIGAGCLVSSFFIFAKQLKIPTWGANIRMAIASVIVFWTPIEILGRLNFFHEIWTSPMEHIYEMVIILATFTALGFYLWYKSAHKKN